MGRITDLLRAPHHRGFTEHAIVHKLQCGTPHNGYVPRPGLSGGWAEDQVVAYGVDAALPAISVSWMDGFVRCGDWHEFERAMRDAVCGVAVLPDLASHPHVPDLIDLKRSRPAQPIVLVTRQDFANMTHVRYLPVEEVVPLGCPPSSLAASVAKAVQDIPYRQIESRIHSATLPEQLRRALLHLWTATPCVMSVESLAVWLGCGRSTFYEAWTSAFGGRPPRSIKEVIGWIVLVRMIQLRDAGHSWKRVERILGVGASTLDRTAARLLKQSRATASSDRTAVLTLFESEVLSSILNASSRRSHGTATNA